MVKPRFACHCVFSVWLGFAQIQCRPPGQPMVSEACPVFSYPRNVTLELGVAATITPTITNPIIDANNIVVFAVINPLPVGMLLNSATGVISGTPTSPSSISSAVQATTTLFSGYDASAVSTGVVIDFKVGPANNPVSVSFIDTDNRENVFAGTVNLVQAPVETGIVSYQLYWGTSASSIVAGSTAFATLPVNASNLVYQMPRGTVAPVGTSYIIAYSFNVVTGLRPVACVLVDYGTCMRILALMCFLFAACVRLAMPRACSLRQLAIATL